MRAFKWVFAAAAITVGSLAFACSSSSDTPDAAAPDAGCTDKPQSVKGSCTAAPTTDGGSTETCIEYTGSSYTIDVIAKDCVGGTVSTSSCKSTSLKSCLVNCGAPNETVYYYYAPLTTSEVSSECAGQDGTQI